MSEIILSGSVLTLISCHIC